MAKIASAILAVLFLVSCSTLLLERHLDKGIKDWYEMHSVLMETKIPCYMNVEYWDENGVAFYSEKQISERKYFLRLSPELQKKYISMFWKMRWEGLEEIFYERVDYANVAFGKEGKIGWRTDRGRVLLLCGPPQHVTAYTSFDMSLPDTGDTSGDCLQIWTYLQGSHYVEYYFYWEPPNQWRDYMGSRGLSMMSYRREYEDHCKEIFKPTENGWMMWYGIMREYGKEK